MVADGYKKTEIGVIPIGWKEKKLGEIVDVVSGGTPSTTVLSYWNGSIDWYTPTEIGKKKYVSSSLRKITEEGYQNCSAKILPIGSILFTSRAGIGDTSILMAEGCTNQGFQSLVAKINIDNEFIYYLVSTLKSKFLQNASGSTFLEISPHKVKAIEVLIPPKKEQQAIATALSDVDALIASLESLIAKKEDIKTATMQQLLTGKKRLDGFSGEWEEKKLGDIVTVIGGGTPSTTITKYWNGHIDWYTPTEVGKNKYISKSIRTLTDEGFQNSSTTILPIGTILFTSRAGIGDISILMVEGCTNQGFQSFVVKKDIDNEFIYYLTSTLTSKFLQNASGSTFLEISPNQVKQIEVLIPNYVEQQAIASILSDMDKELEALKTRLEKTKAIKEGMMQELLTGKTRLLQEVS